MWVYSHAAFNFMLEIDYMFYSDRPINSGNEDKLNRKGFARLLARTLVNLAISNPMVTIIFPKAEFRVSLQYTCNPHQSHRSSIG